MTIAMLDIDGFRFDKAAQVNPDSQGEYGESIRQCAQRFGKTNFFMPGEITVGNTLGSVYLGRGRQPDMVPENITRALTLRPTDNKYFIRERGKNALDAGAFHYSIYRSLTRFLGLDGNLSAGYDVPVSFVDTWNTMLTTNDLSNAYTGEFDPRHMYGVTNQDVFRWSAIKDGTKRMLLGLFVTTLEIPGIPLLLWGEEQAFYVLDNTAKNYVFGRQPMSSNLAWQSHGCYRLGSSQYFDFPLEAALDGCNDDSVGLDHRDPTHPVRNIIKVFYNLRAKYPVLNDGFSLASLSNQTHQIFLPGSNGTATEIGMWSVERNRNSDIQDLGGDLGNQSIWLVYQNDNRTINYLFDCSSSKNTALIAPFVEGTTVKNLLAPYDEVTLKKSRKLSTDASEKTMGCLDEMQFPPYGYKAYIPKRNWLPPPPMLTKFVPGHDARIVSKASSSQKDMIDIEFHFSEEMNCDQITRNLKIASTTEDNTNAQLLADSVSCSSVVDKTAPPFAGGIASTWKWTAKLEASHGIHTMTIDKATTVDAERTTGSVDHVMFRIGQADNVMVFPRQTDYSRSALTKDPVAKAFKFSHKAAGADKWRYTLNWKSSWSDWTDYKGGESILEPQPWSGTKLQKWEGDHVIVQYWSRLAGSSNHILHADANWEGRPPRRFPHLFAHGPFNDFGFDGGLRNKFIEGPDGIMKLHLMTEWPSKIQLNVWGMNPDGKPDQTFVFGDIDNDTVIDRMPPDTLTDVVVNMSTIPLSPYLAYRLAFNDGDQKLTLTPVGHRLHQIILFSLLWVIPVTTAAISIWSYMGAFYGVKFNKIGVIKKKNLLPFFFRSKFEKIPEYDDLFLRRLSTSSAMPTPEANVNSKKRTVLIATMEYDIEDWAIKIKIGGLGVMAQLMGKNLEHQDLIWVVPCVGGIDYPTDIQASPMQVTVLGNSYDVQVQYHQLKNITYVLLDAPVFRQQSKTEPYPPRMDDLDSAVYYSAWNACIAQTIRRFPVDIYHINDYHGAAAPLYLLPETIPVCLSLHNAEFQGLWPMRSLEEREEVAKVYNLESSIVEKYVQFGEVFNLLHAGASYLRIHQRGFGAVGVSKKYGARSYARYPIFWGLKEIGNLPNPDPTDLAPLDPEAENRPVIVDPAFEAARAGLRRQAQEWAGLEINPKAELFVFVGRWSVQKGIDLIADVFPAVLDKHPDVQLICIGPVIDLYGKFAALKLAEMMKKFPKRCYSKPEFTALPPYIFSGAEFALIPSRDEPFGLVAVEFGRKGALGVGARVGGLGQMPGWWFTVESTTNKHLQQQFITAINDALESKVDVRAMMRARSAKQRFPVAQWVKDLDILQSTSIKIHQDQAGIRNRPVSRDRPPSPPEIPIPDMWSPPEASSSGLGRTLSLGVRTGPGCGRRVMGAPDSMAPLRDVNEEDDDDGFTGRFSEHPEVTITEEQAQSSMHPHGYSNTIPYLTPSMALPPPILDESRGRDRARALQQLSGNGADERRLRSVSPNATDSLLVPQGYGNRRLSSADPVGRSISLRRVHRGSVLSLNEVVGTKHDYKLQKVDPTFNDAQGEYYKAFESMLQKAGNLGGDDLCIGDYLATSEKAWFTKMRAARLGRSREPSPNPASRPQSLYQAEDDNVSIGEGSMADEFLLGEGYQRPSMVKRWLQTRIGDWPIYSLLLGLGQIISVNSHQITLLTGNQGQTPEKLYIIGAIFMVTTCLWWITFRMLKSVYVLSLPWLFYGMSFLLVGVAPFLPTGAGRDWVRNVAVGMYTTASSSGSIFFALNFGDEGRILHDWLHGGSLLTSHRRISNKSMGVSSLLDSGNTTNLRYRPFLLGKHPAHTSRRCNRKDV